MTERDLFIVNTLMLAVNFTMIVVQIIIGAAADDTDLSEIKEENTDDE